MKSKEKFCSMLLLLLVSCSSEENTVPIDYDRNIYLQCKINDSISGNFLFDTGAYGLYIDSTFNSRPSLQFEFFDYENAETAAFKRKLILSCDEITAEPALVSPFKAKETFGRKCDGIIGWDFFKKNRILIDYSSKNITVFSKGEKSSFSGYSEIPVIIKDNKILVELTVKINDSTVVKGPFAFDTGFGGTLYLTGATTRKFSLNKLSPKFEYGINWGNFKQIKSTGFVVKASSMKISDYSINDVYIECSADQEGVLSDGDYLGLLGNRVLENFLVILDLGNKKIYIKESKKDKDLSFRLNGLSLLDRTDITDGFIVTGIFRNSTVDERGLRTGDILTEVDGRSVKVSPDSLLKLVRLNVNYKKCTFKRGDSSFVLNIKTTIMK